MKILAKIVSEKKKRKKLLAVLIDPDKFNKAVIDECNRYKPDFIFVGGSNVSGKDFKQTIRYVNENSSVPVVIFPGDEHQIDKNADAILLLSLLSSRNPDYLFGKHVSSAFRLKKSQLEIIPTAYILIDDSGKSSTANVTASNGISPRNRQLIANSALAAEQLGFKIIYLEAGSGAEKTIPTSLLKKICNLVSLPIFAGGGVDSAKKAKKLWEKGADVVVVGNAIEREIGLIQELCQERKQLNKI